jgi:hypothetical protein
MPPKTKKNAKKKEIEQEIDAIEINNNENQVNEHVVLQLNISSESIENIISSENDTNNDVLKIPEPYDPDCNISGLLDHKLTKTFSNDIDNKNKQHHHEIICYWCCHNIFQIEFGMPIRYDVFHNSFTVYGSFCSLECVAAYNYSIHMGCDRVCEINSWIQLLGKMYGYTKPIRPAPSRYLLKLFNGPLTIDEFRNSHKEQTKSLVINIPPFIHISSQMEILNTSFIDNNKKSEVVNSKKINISKSIQQKNEFLIKESI